MTKIQSSHIKHSLKWQLLALLAIYAIGLQLVLDFSSWHISADYKFSLIEFLGKFCINYPNLVLISFLNLHLINFLDKRYPWKSKRKIPQRLVIEILIGSILAVIQVVVINMIFSIYVDETINFNNYLFSAIVSIIINLILLTTMEFYFQIRRQYDTDLDNERLKKENLQFRYAQLKHQVNPHFLFNSLNSLSSLITIDQYRAKESIRKLSQVYRYVLEHGEKRWITLKEELEFINSYIYLLKIRFQEDLIIEIKIPEAHHQKQIAPMTLQLLIENAVKHNIIEENDPLKIEITFDDDKLMIKNQLKPKQSGYSKGIGLQNLKQEYEHQGESLQVDEAAGEFRVTVPLLKI